MSRQVPPGSINATGETGETTETGETGETGETTETGETGEPTDLKTPTRFSHPIPHSLLSVASHPGPGTEAGHRER